MSKNLLRTLLVFPALLGAFMAVVSPSVAAETNISSDETILASSTEQTVAQTLPASVAQALPTATVAQALPAATDGTTSDAASLNQINRYVREGRANQLGQVTSVSQLTDVRPTDWAFQALQSLVERYGCIVGYPDKTYRGNRAMTRYEFAAGLNSCLDKIQELIAAATADFVKKEDLEVVKRLQEEFATELAALRGRVESLEVRTATLEKQQFSTTTKLSGEVIFAVTDEFAQPGRNETVFQDRVRLTLTSSFSGQDKLIVRLAAGNADPFRTFDRAGNATGSILEGFQQFNFGSTGGNRVFADWVAYYFPVGENIQVYIPAYAGLHYDYMPTHAGYFEDFDGGNGGLSYFASRNPIYDIGGGSGIGATFGAGKALSLSLGYLADNGSYLPSRAASTFTLGANNPASEGGLFNGSYSALAQINFTPNDKLSVGLAYVNAFRKRDVFDGGGGAAANGTSFANFQDTNGALGKEAGSVVNGGGISAVFKLNEKIAINGWGSFFRIDALGDGIGRRDVWSYALGLSFPDFGKPGNLLGVLAGTPPYAGGIGEVPIHVEGFYRVRLTDNISITPGVIWVINPGQNKVDTDTLIGTVRTTFTF
ncbi:carbohydrate porin [Phormidium sp. CLA17]|uniref:iron uptake porin n=1 Tax=Leptolyngbya sp. Cla-17 TaxID=2803751 RepID=UPI001490FAB9|nr:iron uptake porin [Leptolyngbya sp. Cla-17]MBM0740543.1 carbohydrate porin [Leptolyngbya sp. Cla-17]